MSATLSNAMKVRSAGQRQTVRVTLLSSFGEVGASGTLLLTYGSTAVLIGSSAVIGVPGITTMLPRSAHIVLPDGHIEQIFWSGT
jgi:predicted metal-dependent RNase